MGKIYYVPLEIMEQRYTQMFNMEMMAISDVTLYPINFEPVIFDAKQFLDFPNSCLFKSLQLGIISKLFSTNSIKDGDTFLFADILFPGIETVRLLAEMQGIKVFIVAFNHAGRADKFDLVQQLGDWMDHSEQAWHKVCDMIFVGSGYHMRQVLNKFHVKAIRVTGMPFNSEYYEMLVHATQEKRLQNGCIWPHRPCTEKGFSEFMQIAQQNPNIDFHVTSGGKEDKEVSMLLSMLPNVFYHYGLTKVQYLEMVNYCKYYLSTAYQETFGYTLHEAIHYNCILIAPDRACYSEFVPASQLYTNISEVPAMFKLSHQPTNGLGRDRFSGNKMVILNHIDKLRDENI